MRKRMTLNCNIVKVVMFITAFLSCLLSETVRLKAEEKGRESDSIYVATIYNEESGLPTGDANALIQTTDGYIWIGSYGGLTRYDGENFRNYSLEGRIGSSSIRALFEDSKGQIWIGTNDDGIYVFKSDTFIKLHNEDERSFLSVRGFAETSDGRIYAASNSGIAEISSLWVKPLAINELKDEFALDISCDCYDRIWVANQSGNVYVLQKDRLVASYSSSEFTDEGYINCVEYGNRFIYLGTSDSGVRRLSITDERLENFTIADFSAKGIGTVNNITTNREGEVLVSGLDGFGLFDTYHNFIKISEYDNALSANCATKDYEGNYWVASSSYGVIRFTKGCFKTYNKVSDLSDTTLNSIAFCKGKYYIGTDKGLIICDEGWNRIENYLTKRMDGLRVRCTVTDKDGYVWIATYSQYGAVKYDPVSGNTLFFGDEQGVLGEKIRVIYPLSDGTVAIGTQMGVTLIRDDRVYSTIGSEAGLENTTILCFMEMNGDLYIGTDGAGIYVLRNGRLVSLSYDQGLLSQVVLRMVPDSERSGNFFVCASEDLYYYEDDSFRRLDFISKGFGSIYDVYDRNGKLWILQNNGIYTCDREEVLKGDTVELMSYGAQHGLTGTLAANTWHYMDAQGRLFLATRNGVSIFEFRGSDVVMPKGIVNSINVDGVDYEHPANLVVPKDAQRLTIDFSALSFTDTANVKIGYLLENFDQTEIFTTEKSNTVSYTNLPGGSYRFVMRIYHPVTNEITAEISAVIEKRKKPLEFFAIKVLLCLLIIGIVVCIVFLIFKTRLSTIRNHQKELTALSEQALLTVARAIDAKDQYTKGHSVRVAIYSREMAKRMGMSEDDQQRVYYIGLLHDVGKIGIPDGILNKPGRLNDDEREIIKRHPKIGGQILENFTAVEGIADGARYHHERYDGDGYNEGKKGTDIPLIARIIGVADTYDAMSSNRCYRKGLSNEVIAEELKRCSGTQFDPEIVPYMLAIMDDKMAPVYDE